MTYPAGGSATQTAILVTIGVVALAGVGGVTLAPASAVQIIGFCTLIVVALLNLIQQAQAAGKAEEVAAQVQQAAGKVEKVKQAVTTTGAETSAKLEDLATVASATHALVNSNMSVQLKLNAAVTRRLANLTGDPGDVAAAELAEKLMREHDARQSAADVIAANSEKERTAS